MKRLSILPVVLVVGLAASIALAASDRVVAPFESLASSGISGDARLNPMPSGATAIHVSLSGLQPNTQYFSLIYQNGTCTTGGTTTQLAQFTANGSGKVQFNSQVAQNLTQIKSISVQLVSDQSVQACAAVQ